MLVHATRPTFISSAAPRSPPSFLRAGRVGRFGGFEGFKQGSTPAWSSPRWYSRSEAQCKGSAKGKQAAFAGGAAIVGTVVGLAVVHRKPVAAEAPGKDSIAGSPSLSTSSAVPDEEDDEIAKTLLARTLAFLNDNILEPIATGRRFLHLLIIFLPVILTSPVLLFELVTLASDRRALRKGGKPRRRRERITTRWWYTLLVRSMETAGPTFIKLAQWAGSRTDLFPAALCMQFGRLHSNGKPHSLAHTKRVLEKAFRRPFSEIFIEFDETPLGIGAVAQVYKATLNPTLLPNSYLGPKHTEDPDMLSRISSQIASPADHKLHDVPSSAVAIKVLHPRVDRLIKRDLKIMGFFAWALNLLPGAEWLSFPEEVEVFGLLMRSQLDLTVEAHNLDRFEGNFSHRKTVSFPRPLNEYTTHKVLIEEHEDAVPLRAFLREGGGPYDTRIADIGLDAFLSMLLIDNFVHSDLHPGNIMVKFYKPTTGTILRSLWAKLIREPEIDAGHENVAATTEISHRLRAVSHDHERWLEELKKLDDQGYQPELVFIDPGLVTELNDVNRRNFLDLFGAVADFDGYRAGRLMIERCRTPDLVIDDETFALKMQHLMLRVKAKSFSLAQIRIGDLLSEVLSNVRAHHVKLEADFVNTVISILLLEGIGRQLNPDLDLFKNALPILRRLGSQMNAMDTFRSGITSRQVGAMLKLWIWIEARQFAGIAVSEVDDLVRYDFLMPNI